jgi:phage I-like protein
MPFPTIKAAQDAGFPTTAEGIDLTLVQINKLASIHDAIKAEGTADNPMAAAWTAWKKVYEKKGDQWVKREASGAAKEYFFGKAVPLSGDGQPPMELQLLRFGEPIWTPNGTLELTDTMAEHIILNTPPIDGYIGYEHLILESAEAPAAGWFSKVENRGEGEDGGLWVVVKEWTARAEKAIKEKEYKYLSVAIDSDGVDWRTGEPIGPVLHSVGLTGTPRWKNQRPLVNKDGQTKKEAAMLKALIKLLALKDDATEKDVTAVIEELLKRPEKAPLAAKEVLEALSLKEEATLEDIQGAVKALKEAGEKAEKTLKDKDPDPEKYVLKSDHDTTVTALKEVQGKLDKTEAEKVVVDEMHNPKGSRITGAERDWAISYAMKDRKGFDEWLDKTPVKVPAGTIAMKEEPGLKDVPNEVQTKVNKQLGISKDTWEKREKKDEE